MGRSSCGSGGSSEEWLQSRPELSHHADADTDASRDSSGLSSGLRWRKRGIAVDVIGTYCKSCQRVLLYRSTTADFTLLFFPFGEGAHVGSAFGVLKPFHRLESGKNAECSGVVTLYESRCKCFSGRIIGYIFLSYTVLSAKSAPRGKKADSWMKN